jgi:hypothetical protein
MSTQTQNPTGTALSTYSTCDISDAMLKLGIPTGGFLPGLSLWSPHRQEGPTRVAGPAYTVKFVKNHQTNAPVLAEHYVCFVDLQQGRGLHNHHSIDRHNPCRVYHLHIGPH